MSVKFHNTFTEDDRWLDAGPVAFAVHVAACCYSDLRLTDGHIPKARVRRVALTLGVPPDEADRAAERLVESEFWTATDDGYQIVGYLEDGIGFSKEETEQVRAVWATDKRWRRRHRNGNHDICPPDKCPVAAENAARSTTEPGTTSDTDKPNVRKGQRKSPGGTSGVSPRLDTTRPDPTRPDPIKGSGKGRGKRSGSGSGTTASRGSSAPPPAGSGKRSRSTATAPRCPHGVPGGLERIVPGDMKRRFRCSQCYAIAPDPTYRYNAWQEWIAQHPTLDIEVHCTDPAKDKVAQAVGRATFVAGYATRDGDVPPDSTYARQLLAYIVDQLEPGRVNQVLSNGTHNPHQDEPR